MSGDTISNPSAPSAHRYDFWKYWCGQTISNLGSSITLFALPLLVYKLTGSALNLGLSMAATFLPYPLFGLLLGAMVDRFDRKRIMLLADVGRALVIASIPLQALFWPLSIWWVYAVSFMHSTLTICFETGEFAAIPALVSKDDLVKANGRIQASYSAASIAGPVIAGLLVVLLSLSSLLFLDAASFLVSAGSLLLIRRSFNTSAASEEKKHIGQDVLEGLRYVIKHPVLRNISLLMALYNFVSVTATAQIVLFAKTRLQANDLQVSLLYSASSVGIVLLSLSAATLRKYWSFSRVALSTLFLLGVCTVVLSFMRWFWIAAVLQALIGGLGILFNINTGSLRQVIVPNQLLGRVMSIASVLAWSAIPLGSILGGAAIALTGNIVLVYAVIGGITTLLPLIFAFTALGRAERYIPATVPVEASPVTDPSV